MKTAVLTGATSGIGNSILREFIDDGYTVYAGYRDIRQKKELSAISSQVIPFRIDLTKKWTVEDAIKTINQSVEKIDVLINVAGKVIAGPLETLSVNKIREQFEVNTFAQLEFAQGLFEKLDGGKIINMSSMASYGMFPFLAPYCASKKALDMLFNSLRIETGTKVKIISVKPGVIATPLWQKAVDENRENLGAGKYKVVADFLIANAMKNSSDGLNPVVVAKKVLQIANCEKPKNSYVIGFDAKGVQLLSKLPQKFIDVIVEHQLVKRVKEQLNKVMIIQNPTDSVSEQTFVEQEKQETSEPDQEENNHLDTLFEPETDISLEHIDINNDNAEENNSQQEEFEEIEEQKHDDGFESALQDAIDANQSDRED